MIGYTFDAIGFSLGDLLLFACSLLIGGWSVTTWRRGLQSRAVRWLTVALMPLTLLPFVLVGLTYLAASRNAPAASAAQPAPDVPSLAVNLGAGINTPLRESEPSFTADGRTMYFNCQNADICVSHRIGTWAESQWTPPERLGASISTGYFEVEPLINAAGDKLYFQSNRPAGRLQENPWLSPFVTNAFFVVNYLATTKLGVSFWEGLGLADVWVSYKVNGVWSAPQNLNDILGEPPVNTAFHDHCLSFSADGNEAFWTSTRPGGFGGNDIWTARRIDGTWTAPENLSANVNGPGDEHHSLPTPDGRVLYVTTTRSAGFGEEDIYRTRRGAAGTWGALMNLGPLVNGPGDDRCVTWTPDGKIFLFDSTRAGGFGSLDLWWLSFQEVAGLGHPPAAAAGSATTHALVP